MQAKITLTSNGIVFAVESNDLKNWQDVMCSLKRSEYGGVVRSFTSKFEFTGAAYRHLFDLYLADGIESQCELCIYAMRDDWTYEEMFRCPLDFSTAEFDGYVFGVSSVDNTLAALIRAAKGTKYEMLVGTDIIPDGMFMFDRIPMTESATYAFTQGDSDDNGALTVTMSNGDLPWLGCVKSEMSVGGVMLYKDDQDPTDGGCVLVAYKPAVVTIDWSVNIDRRVSSGSSFGLSAQVKNGGEVKTSEPLGTFLLGGDNVYAFVGSFDTESDLPDPGSDPSNTRNWALVGGIVWKTEHKGWGCVWESLELTEEEWRGKEIHAGTLTVTMDKGDRLVINGGITHGTTTFKLNSSEFSFKWQSIGEPCDIPMFTPRTVCEAILKKVVGDRFNAAADFSDYDPRLAKTRLMAAESVRALAEPKLYSSFSEFATWMEAVFGYVYWIGEPFKKYDRIINVGRLVGTGYSFETSMYHGEVNPDNIVYIIPHGRFFYHDPDENKYYISFEGHDEYGIDNNGRPQLGVLYRFAQGLYYFTDGSATPHPYEYDQTLADEDFVMVHFQHRSELFGDDIGRTIDNVKGLRYTIGRAQIFSAIEVGYEKKDYDRVNGRDEFNFLHTYTTGTSVSEKKLSLISKYRADSYGIEFAAQSRGKATTDSKADQDVFFAYCIPFGRNAKPDRTAPIVGVLNDKVFNAVFNPMSCALANAGYIGMQSEGMRLTFASATGNSSVTVSGQPISADIDLGPRLLTTGVVEFDTDSQSMPEDVNAAIKVRYNGMEIVGYLSDLDIKAMRPEPAKYKLIVKSISPI